jgi:UDP-galactopyranose mutase
MHFDYLIVGAGFSGLTLAERIVNELGATCLVVDRRAHIGGNAADEYDDHGVLIHKYGPHYFRTDSPRVLEYLSRFTAWRPVNYQILSWTRQRYWQFPVNLNTFEQMLGRSSTEEEFRAHLEKVRVPVASPRNSEEVIVSQIGWELYDQFFKGYTRKQWRKDPAELDASVCARIPLRTNRDDAYLREKFQALPLAGYTRMFERMLAASPGVRVLLKTDYREVMRQVRHGRLIHTGAIDEFYDYRHGVLPYRSLRFEAESFTPDQLKEREPISGRQGFWQPAVQVNYPNEFDFTRIVEVKHATGQLCANSTIVREYPADYVRGGEAYYPMPTPEARKAYETYAEQARLEPRAYFAGRLATYRYLNMDQIVDAALDLFETIRTDWIAEQARCRSAA